MRRFIQPMSGPRWLTLVASIAGLALFVVAYTRLRGEEMQSVGPSYLVFGLPFLFGVAVSILPMQKRTRITFFWLIALCIGFAGVLTLFTGAGVYNAFAVIVFLVAAWFENESGPPSRAGNQA